MARSATITQRKGASGLVITKIDWIADETDGSFAALELDPLYIPRGSLECLDSVPGTPTPTDQYDITIKDPRGLDILGGNGADRGIVGAERISLLAHFDGPLSLEIAGNSVTGAKGTIMLYWREFN